MDSAQDEAIITSYLESDMPSARRAALAHSNTESSNGNDVSIPHAVGSTKGSAPESLCSILQSQISELDELVSQARDGRRELRELLCQAREEWHELKEDLESANRRLRRVANDHEAREWAYATLVKGLFQRLAVLIQQQCTPISRTQAAEEVQEYKDLILLWCQISGREELDIGSAWDNLLTGTTSIPLSHIQC